MQRVLILGCGGAGKSTLAQELASRTGLPLISLDGHYWRPGWVEEEPGRWRARVDALASGSAWIMDGNYGGTLEARLARADTAILIDRGPLVCLWRLLRRRIQWAGRVRPGMQEGCVERLGLPFIWYVLTYRRSRLSGVMLRLDAAAAHGTTVHVLRSDSEVKRFLDSLEP